MLLAIDTSSGSSVAVVTDDGQVAAERSVTETMRHAEVIGELIAGVLEDASAAPADITAVAAGMGPGPFTGLRVGIAAAKAFAIGIDASLIPVVSHDAIAAAALRDATGGILVVTDARRRERYWSAYSGLDDDGVPVRSDGPGLCPAAELPHAELPRLEDEPVPAGEIGRIAAILVTRGHAGADARPLYLRSPDVTPSAGRKRVTA